MAEKSKNSEELENDQTLVKKDTIPNFFPTYRIQRRFYPIPTIIVVIIAGILSYLTYVEAGLYS